MLYGAEDVEYGSRTPFITIRYVSRITGLSKYMLLKSVKISEGRLHMRTRMPEKIHISQMTSGELESLTSREAL